MLKTDLKMIIHTFIPSHTDYCNSFFTYFDKLTSDWAEFCRQAFDRKIQNSPHLNTPLYQLFTGCQSNFKLT